MNHFFAVLALSLLFVPSLHADCTVARGPVKAAVDAEAALINATAIPMSIDALRRIPAALRPLPQERRIRPVEMTTYSVSAMLTEYRRDDHGDYYLVLSDAQGRTILAVLPSPACVSGSRYATAMGMARRAFESRFQATSNPQSAMMPIEVHGVGFFDFLTGERGAAPNGLTLHPVTYINIFPAFLPEPPQQRSSRRRAASPTPAAPTCHMPALTLSASKTSACDGEPLVLSWQASESGASVTIDGVGASLPASGTATVTVSSTSVWSGHATTSCGSGAEAVVVVSLQAASSARLTGPTTVERGKPAPLSCFISGASSWALSSSLRNSFSPDAGTGPGAFGVTYSATHGGTDTVTLTTSGGPCGAANSVLRITVTEPAPPPGGLLCCDKTRSPTCFSCADKRGCCSGHGGVCGCP
ncbi:MAG TPA: hypothetical protein VF618_21710 [Thermoanaerobaculia bacterium]